MSKKPKQHNNKKVIEAGRKLALQLIKEQLIKMGHKFAELAVIGAVKAWDEHDGSNLTGNTRTGFCSAVYWDGVIQSPIHTVGDVDSNGEPTAGYVKVRSTNFRSYYDGHVITPSGRDPYVSDYADDRLEFQDTNVGRTSKEDTIAFLMQYKPEKKGMCVITANVSPYATFLVQERDMDILVTEGSSGQIREKILMAANSVDKI